MSITRRELAQALVGGWAVPQEKLDPKLQKALVTPKRTNESPEKDIQGAIIAALLWHKFMVLRVNSGVSQPTYNGKRRWVASYWLHVPGHKTISSSVVDLLVFGPRNVKQWGAIECKAEGKDATDGQSMFLRWAREYGAAFTGVARSVNDALAIVEGT